MRLVVTLESREFGRTPEGAVWTQGAFAYSFWTRYLSVFDDVRVVARAAEAALAAPGWKRADGPAVSFAPLPYYVGPWQYLWRARQVHKAGRNAIGCSDAVILRVSSNIASCVEPLLRKTGHPYGVEVVADPHDVYAPGSIEHPLRPFFRWLGVRRLSRQCATAVGVAYVTREALQRRYPASPGAFSIDYSDVDLPEAAFVSAPRLVGRTGGAFTLVTVGSLAQLYKAPDVLIDAVAVCVRKGLDLHLVLVGEGRYRAGLEARARALGLEERVRFRGQLPGSEAVREQLDRADVFVLPSRAEGLPRALVEAMARGLPCIGSNVGGIPELLPAEELVPPGDVAALADRIREVVGDPERRVRMSKQNLEKAREYRAGALREKRDEFYRYVREVTEEWGRVGGVA